MDLRKISVIAAASERLSWLGNRQDVLARNIANADTPGYRPHDLKPLRFGEQLRRQVSAPTLAATRDAHLSGTRPPGPIHETFEARRSMESTPTGNAVVLEEQMAKVNETTLTHQLISRVYHKNLEFLRIAAGRPR